MTFPSQDDKKQQGNWVPMSKALLSELPIDRSYTRLEAMFSLSLDYDQNSYVSVCGYSRLWRWSEGRVKRFFDEIGASIEYPENTANFRNQRGVIVMVKAEESRSNGKGIQAIDSKWLRNLSKESRSNGEGKAKESCSSTKEPNPKPNKSPSPDALRLSELLAGMILDNFPTCRELNNGKRDGSVNRWARDIGKLILNDKQSIEDIEKVITWCQQDSFWKGRILSGGNLNKHWSRLHILSDCRSAKQPTGRCDAIGAVTSDESTAIRKVLDEYRI